MPRIDGASICRTVLHDWHFKSGARMVPFAGWSMPIQYKTGIINEHLTTRRKATLFDISHMGRFHFRGPGSKYLLDKVLTNDVQKLGPGHAQYTFLANEQGGAIDDAYLFHLREGHYILVVNAINRSKDWNWIKDQIKGQVEITDETTQQSMIALQGPDSSRIIENLVPLKNLPENKRNRLTICEFSGQDIVISRTGYTGENVCFEIFLPNNVALDFWEDLINIGATPAGLGARDSLRLEAGLPLYGHELGEDPEGEDIPIFANRLARFGVRTTGSKDYIGRSALEKQREEYRLLIQQKSNIPSNKRLLKRLIQPFALIGQSRPVRARFKVFNAGEHVGFVTSGTSIPVNKKDKEIDSHNPRKSIEMRPIGLALINSSMIHTEDRPVNLAIEDFRGRRLTCELVATNLLCKTKILNFSSGAEINY